MSDYRASTPTAAADVEKKKELLERLELLSENKKNYIESLINLKMYKLDTYEKIVDPYLFLSVLKKN